LSKYDGRVVKTTEHVAQIRLYRDAKLVEKSLVATVFLNSTISSMDIVELLRRRGIEPTIQEPTTIAKNAGS